jgi:hypothetical protein
MLFLVGNSITNILKYLKLPTLEIRGKIKRLCLFHKAFHHQIAINIPDYIKQQNNIRSYFRLIYSFLYFLWEFADISPQEAQ